MMPVKIPIEDHIDLHTFRPEEVSELLSEYFSECIKNGIFTVRVIHGKGKGFLKKGVVEFLKKSPLVESFKDAPIESGGWGATIVKFKHDDNLQKLE
ncbi:MAG: DNA mismatch repair protein MutS [Desulfobacteraceae bacterium]|nr:MAG: DNA mismatch repair protein MutS [Desulfobacteraceae bacterium]